MKRDFLMTRAMLALLCTILLPSLAMADRIVLRNGRTIDGVIVSQNASELQVKSNVGTVRIKASDIVEIVRTNVSKEEFAGDSAATSRRYDEAIAMYERAGKLPNVDAVTTARLTKKIADTRAQREAALQAALSTKLASAKQLIDAGRFDDALRNLEAVRAGTRDESLTSAILRLSAETYLRKSVAARDRVAEIEADEALKKAVELDPYYYRARLLLGERLMRNSISVDRGITEILKGLELAGTTLTESDKVRYNYAVAERYYIQRDYERAAQHFASAIADPQKFPQFANAIDRAVETYVRLGESVQSRDQGKTIENLKEALRLNPKNADAHFLLARIYRDSGQIPEAIDALQKVLEINPLYKRANYFLALAYIDRNEYDKARIHLNKQLEQTPNDYDTLCESGQLHITVLNYTQAKVDLDKAVGLERDLWRGRLLSAELSYAQEQFDEALVQLNQVLQLKPDAVEAYVLRGKVLIGKKNFDEAKTYFNEVSGLYDKISSPSLRLRRLIADAKTSLGDIDMAQDSPRSAESRYKDALLVLSDYAPAFRRIGDVKRRLGDEASDKATKKGYYEEGETAYKQAISLSPQDANFYLALGILYHKSLRDAANALLNYNKYLKLGGRDVATVQKWIEECGTGNLGSDDEATTGSATAADGSTTGTQTTTGTVTLDSTTTGTAPADAATTGTATPPSANNDSATTAPAAPGAPAANTR